MRYFPVLWFLPILLMAASFALPVGFGHVRAAINGQEFTIYIARNPLQWMRGFQGRRVSAGEAMLFEFPREAERSFWMLGTLTPLDIVFLDEDFHITSLHANARPSLNPFKTYSGRGKYVLELRGGVAEKLNLSAGERLSLSGPLAE